MELFIIQGNIDLDASNKDGDTAMHIAASNGSIDVLSHLSQTLTHLRYDVCILADVWSRWRQACDFAQYRTIAQPGNGLVSMVLRSWTWTRTC